MGSTFQRKYSVLHLKREKSKENPFLLKNVNDGNWWIFVNTLSLSILRRTDCLMDVLMERLEWRGSLAGDHQCSHSF